LSNGKKEDNRIRSPGKSLAGASPEIDLIYLIQSIVEMVQIGNEKLCVGTAGELVQPWFLIGTYFVSPILLWLSLHLIANYVGRNETDEFGRAKWQLSGSSFSTICSSSLPTGSRASRISGTFLRSTLSRATEGKTTHRKT